MAAIAQVDRDRRALRGGISRHRLRHDACRDGARPGRDRRGWRQAHGRCRHRHHRGQGRRGRDPRKPRGARGDQRGVGGHLGRSRSRAPGADDHRRRRRGDRRRVRRVLLQRRRRGRRALHALYAVRRAARGLREVPDAAQHRDLRADLHRRRHRALRRHHPGSALRPHRRPITACRQGHLPVRSYLAVPVRSRTGEVLGGLFFGHSEAGVFGELAKERVVGPRQPGRRRDGQCPSVPGRTSASWSSGARPRRAPGAERDPGGAGRQRGRGAQQGRGGAAPGAEDGGGRPAHRRRRARLQQPADRHHRRPRHDPAQPSPADDGARPARGRHGAAGRAARRQPDQRGCWPSRAASRSSPSRSTSTCWSAT